MHRGAVSIMSRSAQERNSRKVMANLRRERPANNLIGETNLERIAALNALNRLVAYLGLVVSADSNMNLLFGRTACAFNCHHNIVRVCRHWVSAWHSTTHGHTADGWLVQEFPCGIFEGVLGSQLYRNPPTQLKRVPASN